MHKLTQTDRNLAQAESALSTPRPALSYFSWSLRALCVSAQLQLLCCNYSPSRKAEPNLC